MNGAITWIQKMKKQSLKRLCDWPKLMLTGLCTNKQVCICENICNPFSVISGSVCGLFHRSCLFQRLLLPHFLPLHLLQILLTKHHVVLESMNIRLHILTIITHLEMEGNNKLCLNPFKHL